MGGMIGGKRAEERRGWVAMGGVVRRKKELVCEEVRDGTGGEGWRVEVGEGEMFGGVEPGGGVVLEED